LDDVVATLNMVHSLLWNSALTSAAELVWTSIANSFEISGAVSASLLFFPTDVMDAIDDLDANETTDISSSDPACDRATPDVDAAASTIVAEERKTLSDAFPFLRTALVTLLGDAFGASAPLVRASPHAVTRTGAWRSTPERPWLLNDDAGGPT
jgi:hypothetical protein